MGPGSRTICYGMLEELPVISTPSTTVIDSPSLVSSQLQNDGTVRRTSDSACVGQLDEVAAKCFLTLIDQEKVHIQLMVKAAPGQTTRRKGPRLVAHAAAILYGREDLADDIGFFLDKCKLFLQDPFGCDQNVPYKNPHCLSSIFEEPKMTFDLHEPIAACTTLSLLNSLKALETNDELPERDQPSSLRPNVTLHRHQKQALSFFLSRESTNNTLHVWKKTELVGSSSVYVNDVNGASQDVPPPTWRGGILADEMGLGKTLQMISLIAADKEAQGHQQNQSAVTPNTASTSTLIVVPLPLMGVWEDQLKRYTKPGALSWVRHYGKRRMTAGVSVSWPDIVFTTYGTLQAEHKRRRTGLDTLFSYQWRRIILDEAHIIRNQTSTSTAICSLDARSRWAVTGTPIQNSLADLSGLLRFLRFRPYDDARVFDSDVIDFFRTHDIEEGTRRLQALCRPFMLRRSLGVIALPDRENLVKTIDFSPEEEEEYQKMQAEFQDYSNYMSETHSGARWINTIQFINSLRMFCNIGLASSAKRRTPAPQLGNVIQRSQYDESPETILASQAALGGINCVQCQQIIDTPEDHPTTNNPAFAYYSECQQLIYCISCAVLCNYQATPEYACNSCGSHCVLRMLSLACVRAAQQTQSEPRSPALLYHQSSKVRAVVQEVVAGLPEKSVILSFWTTSLTMIEQALTAKGIPYVRIDGSLTSPQRENALRKFREEKTVKAILITISCGGVGLDLTAASRVHLLEPQWNPAVEEQALARVHRLGQHLPVVATRYLMRNSIEESVATAKGKKEILYNLLPGESTSSTTNKVEPTELY